MLFVGSILLAIFVVPDPWDVPVVVLGAVIEVGETLIGIRISRRGPVKVGPETLIGQVGVVVEPCEPSGRVRLRGETWMARCDAGADTGQAVRVRGREGLTLLVEPLPVGEEATDDR